MEQKGKASASKRAGAAASTFASSFRHCVRDVFGEDSKDEAAPDGAEAAEGEESTPQGSNNEQHDTAEAEKEPAEWNTVLA